MTSLSKLRNKPRSLLTSANSTRPDFPIHKMGHVIYDPHGGEDDRHVGRGLARYSILGLSLVSQRQEVSP